MRLETVFINMLLVSVWINNSIIKCAKNILLVFVSIIMFRNCTYRYAIRHCAYKYAIRNLSIKNKIRNGANKYVISNYIDKYCD
jgi:hypothetical protein